MKFALLIYEENSEFQCRNDAEKSGEYWSAWQEFSRELTSQGLLTGGNALKEPSTATTVRLNGEQAKLLDGPFAETKELFGGLFILDVDSLDTALEWAKKCPAVTRGAGSVEVRPILEMGD